MNTLDKLLAKLWLANPDTAPVGQLQDTKASLIEYIETEIIGEDDVNTTTSNIKELEKDVRNELRAEQRAKLKEQL